MLLEKLIEQHRVHSFVAHRAELALGVVGHQIRIYLRHLFGHQAELRDAGLIQLRLVMEGDWTQGQDRLTGSGHISDVGFETPRGEKHAQLASIVHITGASTRPDRLTRDAGDVGGSLDERTPDAHGIGLTGNTKVTDVNVAGAVRELRARIKTDGDVPVGCAPVERMVTDGRAADGVGVAEKSVRSVGSVAGADSVAKERISTGGRVKATGGVGKERGRTEGGVEVAGVVVERGIA